MLELEKEKRVSFRSVFKWDKWDLILLIITSIPFLFMWRYIIANGGKNLIINHKTAIGNFNYIKRFFYHEKSHESSKTSIFPFFPSIIWFFTIIFPKGSVIGYYLLEFIINSLVAYVFRRFLSIVVGNTNPILYTCIMSIFPVQMLTARAVLSVNNFLVLEMCLLSLFWHFQHHYLLAITIFITMLTHQMGVVLSVSILIALLLRKQKKSSVLCLMVIVVSLFILTILFYSISPPILDLKSFYVFTKLWKTAKSISTLRDFHALWPLYVYLFFGGALAIQNCLPLGIFVLIATPLSTINPTISLHNQAFLPELVSTYVGFDLLLKQKAFKKSLYIIVPIFIISTFRIRIDSILSNQE